MKTRFTSLVHLKKSTMQRSERLVQKANADLHSASNALQLSYKSLDDIETPQSGSITDLIASRALLESQRALIQHNQEWVEFTQNQVNQAAQQLKNDMIEYEKYSYLELQEIKKIVNIQKKQEAKELDEVALMTYKKEV